MPRKSVVAAVVTTCAVAAGVTTGIIREPHPCTPDGARVMLACTTPVYGDVTLPTISMTAPTNSSTISGSSVTVSATASDNVGVSSVRFNTGSCAGPLQNTDTVAPYSFSLDSTGFANTTLVICATAIDAAGNSNSDQVTVTVSNGGGASPTANLWVDPSGNSSCTRSSTAVTFAAASGHICWNATGSSILQTAMAASSSSAGDTVRVTCTASPLGNQILTTSSHSASTIFRPETDYCVTIESAVNNKTTLALNSGASDLTFEYFNLNGYQTICATQGGCGNAYSIAADGSSAPASSDILFDHNNFDVGKLLGGCCMVTSHLIQRLTFTNNTFGPSCCGRSGDSSPVPINIGKPNSTVGNCVTPTQSCDITITDNLFQFNAINESLWPSSGYAVSAPEHTCTDAVNCHLDSIHDFGSGGTISILRNKMYGQSCQGVFFEEQSNAVYGPINIIGNTASSYANGCNGFISLNMTGAGNDDWTGDINIGFNESPSSLNLLVQDGAYAAGVDLNIFGNYMPKNSVMSFRTSGGVTTTEQCLTTPLAATNLTVSWKYNDWRTGTTCSASDTTGTTTSWVDSSAPPAVTQDMHKTGSTGSADNFVVCASLIGGACPATDFDGDPFASTADAGADQR